MTHGVAEQKAAAGMEDPAFPSSRSSPPSRPSFSDLVQLTKPRITILVLITALVGFLEAAPGPRDLGVLAHMLLGTLMVAAAAAALNQVMEHRYDARMVRTRSRPLPAGRLSAAQGALFGLLLLAGGTAWLALAVNLPAAGLALFTAVSYLLAYTPLKRLTPLATLVGAVPGAVPPMIGWAAATGRLGAGAWTLFAIMFLWQLPHFIGIGVLYRDDYARAGFRLPGVAAGGGRRAAREAVVWSAALLPVSLLPVAQGHAGLIYGAAAVALGLAMLGWSLRLLAAPDDMARARTLFRGSLLYLPVLLALLIAG